MSCWACRHWGGQGPGAGPEGQRSKAAGQPYHAHDLRPAQSAGRQEEPWVVHTEEIQSQPQLSCCCCLLLMAPRSKATIDNNCRREHSVQDDVHTMIVNGPARKPGDMSQWIKTTLQALY